MALNAAGLYGPQVDADCGGVEPMVDQWEDPDHPLLPTRAQLERLAALTGHPVKFFYGPDPAVTGTVWLCYRRKVDGKRCHGLDGRPARPAADPDPPRRPARTRQPRCPRPNVGEVLPGMADPAGVSGRDAARAAAAEAARVAARRREDRLSSAGW